MTFRYCLYGLTIEADAPIDGAVAVTGGTPCDVGIHMQAMPPSAAALFAAAPIFDDENVTIIRHDGAYGFAYADGTRFVIDAAAREIWASWPPASTPEDTATYLLGPILAFVLRRRGTLALHASAVALDGRAIAIAAAPGGGKSTTATAFADRGAAVITDDVLPIVWRGGQPWVLPGYPRVRLWPETVVARYGAAEALPRLTPTWTKRYLDVTSRFQSDPLPLGAVVVLGARIGGAPRIAPLIGHQAAMRLVTNSSMALYLDASMRAEELHRVGALVDRVPLFAAYASDDIARIGELCDRIEAAVAPRELSSRR